MSYLKMKKLRPEAVVPKRATEGSAGMDLCACIEENVTINPGERKVVPTGIAIGIDSNDIVALIYARSGLAIKHGITLSNAVGVIDSDYRGELCVGLLNLSDVPYTIEPKERIAQLVLTPVIMAEPMLVDSLDETQRGEGRFGSTGK